MIQIRKWTPGLILAVLFTIAPSVTWSAETREDYLFTASGDYDNYYTELYARVDVTSGDLVGLSYKSTDPKMKEGFFPVADIANGVVFRKDEGREVIKFKLAKEFSVKDGGVVEIDYLENGVWGTRASYFIQALRVGQDWVPYSSRENGNREFMQMFFYKNTFLGKIVGIDRIEVKK